MARRLAAIMAADVAGYSRLMQEDEAGTLAALRRLRQESFEPLVTAHHGQVVKRMGDGWLVEFPSLIDACTCACQIQQRLLDHEPVRLRIGIHIGDVVFEDEDVYGDGVNIAARIQELAEPGGVLISEDARRQLKGKQFAAIEDAGEHRLKNIADPLRLFRLAPSPATDAASPVDAAASHLPTVAVLPFDNMSGDPEQEYFADGITEDILTALSRYRWLKVIARNSTFGFKGKAVDVRALADQLGATYVVEGSVRKLGQRVRVSAQLIDAATGNHLWAERYDSELENMFEVQDRITDTIVARIEPELGAAERQKVARRAPQNLQAWDNYHLGVTHFFRFTAEDNREAQRLFKRAAELDPRFGEAHAWWAYATVLGMVYWDNDPAPEILDEALRECKRALEIDDQNALFYFLMARVNLARREYDTALRANDVAIRLNPTLAAAYCAQGDSLAYEGRYDEARGFFEKAVALSPNDPQRWAFLTYGALGFLFSGDYETALEWTERASVIPNCQYWTAAHKAVALAYLDRPAEARHAVARLLRERPGFSVAFARRKLFYIKRPEQLALYLDGLRKAGVPED